MCTLPWASFAMRGALPISGRARKPPGPRRARSHEHGSRCTGCHGRSWSAIRRALPIGSCARKPPGPRCTRSYEHGPRCAKRCRLAAAPVRPQVHDAHSAMGVICDLRGAADWRGAAPARCAFGHEHGSRCAGCHGRAWSAIRRALPISGCARPDGCFSQVERWREARRMLVAGYELRRVARFGLSGTKRAILRVFLGAGWTIWTVFRVNRACCANNRFFWPIQWRRTVHFGRRGTK